jgi:hypothetical protein
LEETMDIRMWRGKSAAKWLMAAVAIGVMLWAAKAAAIAAFHWRFHTLPDKVAFPAPNGRVEAMRQDLQVLAQLTSLDHSFTPESSARFERERLALEAGLAQMTPEDFEMEVSRLVAISGNGHTSVVRRSRRLNQVPVRFAWFAEGLFVTRAKDPFSTLLGAQVISIEGRPVAEVLRALRPYVSGTADWARAVSPQLLQSPAALRGMRLAAAAESATYTVLKPSGELQTVELRADAPGSDLPYADPARNHSPEPADSASPQWRSWLTSPKMLPASLRDPDASIYLRQLDNGQGVYVHISSIMGDARGSLSRQLDGVLDAIAPGSLRYAVLDLRFDGGGNYMETLDFTKELPQRVRPDGQIFILTDQSTFSAAIVTFARAKYFAGNRAVVIGERVGDREQFWAEAGAQMELPNSKIRVNFATGYHDWERGCSWRDAPRCFWLNLVYDVPAGSLSPQVPLAWRFSDYSMGVDTVMAEVTRRTAHGGAEQ